MSRHKTVAAGTDCCCFFCCARSGAVLIADMTSLVRLRSRHTSARNVTLTRPMLLVETRDPGPPESSVVLVDPSTSGLS